MVTNVVLMITEAMSIIAIFVTTMTDSRVGHWGTKRSKSGLVTDEYRIVIY